MEERGEQNPIPLLKALKRIEPAENRCDSNNMSLT